MSRNTTDICCSCAALWTTVVLAVLFSVESSAEPLSRAYTSIVHYAENASSSPQNFCVSGNSLYFSADDGLHGQELWCLEPENTPYLAADLWIGPQGSNPRNLLSVAGRLYFVAQQVVKEQTLDVVCSIGNGIDSLRYHLNTDAHPAPAQSITLASVGNQLYGAAYIQGAGREFVQFLPDGDLKYWDTSPGVTSGLSRKQEWFGSVGSVLVFTVQGSSNSARSLWAIGPQGKAHPFADKKDLAMQEGFAFPMSLDVVGGRLYIAASHLQDGVELWVSDGTGQGTRFVKDIYPGPESSFPAGATEFQGVAYFSADDGTHGVELWRTDGSEAGTFLVKDIAPGPENSKPYSFHAAGDFLFFCAETPDHGNELWRTDGTPEGTTLVKDFFPGPKSSNPYQLIAFGDVLLFAADNPEYGEELWRTDGTARGTQLVRDINPGPGISEPYSLTTFSDKVYFCANDGRHGEELWCSDGTGAGTRLVADLNPETRIARSAGIGQLTGTEKGMYFVADDVTHGAELWWSEAETKATYLVDDVAPGALHSDPNWLASHGERLFFSADDREHGRELWQTGPEPNSARLVADLRPGADGSDPEHLLALPTYLLFAAHPQADMTVLYKMPYETSEPEIIAELGSILPGCRLDSLSLVDDAAYAVLCDRTNQYRFALWDSTRGVFDLLPIWLPPSPQWTDIQQLASANGKADSPYSSQLLHCYFALPSMAGRHCRTHNGLTWFSAYVPDSGMELWQSTSGVAEAIPAQDCYPGTGSGSPDQLVTSGGNLYFVAESPKLGRSLWYMPNGLGEARTVDRVAPDAPSAVGPGDLTPFRQGIRLVISSREAADGDRVMAWCGEDGRAPALWQLKFPQAILVHNPQDLCTVGDYLYFTAENPALGRELWRTAGGNDVELVANVLAEPEYRNNFIGSTSATR